MRDAISVANAESLHLIVCSALRDAFCSPSKITSCRAVPQRWRALGNSYALCLVNRGLRCRHGVIRTRARAKPS